MTTDPKAAGTGRIAARIDRLPLTWAQWRLALISQVFWGVIIAADGIPAKVYPYVWLPQHAFGMTAFSLLLAMQFGVGILIGEYLIGIVADRWGRRLALLISTLTIALLMWPTALTNNFTLLMIFFGLSAIGLGGVLSTNVVYMGEFIPPQHRGRVMLGSQVLAVAVYGLLGNIPAILWIPNHYELFINFYCIVSMVVLVPLAWVMPESPRWLESHGRHEEAERVTIALEQECLRRSRLSSLPQPHYEKYAVTAGRHVPMRELFQGVYGRRSMLLLVAWILGYSGMIYGFGGYETLMLRGFGLDADQAFGVILVSSTLGGGGGLAICALLGEAVERRMIILFSAILTAAMLAVLYFVHTVIASYILVTLSWGATEVWLFSMYNYTAASYPTRLRATGTGLTDGVGHLGAVFGPIVAGWLFTATAAFGHAGWFVYVMIPGAVVPAVMIAVWGIDQRRAILEHISA
ncbi:MFS transporter [Rhodopila sp.]|uniref:MFS transporter n=1 Tax=Rhodopila sp. TaxID=2480087 RepID=UPI003D0C378A